MIYRLLIAFGLVLAVVALRLTLGTGAGPTTVHNNRPTTPDQGYSATDATVVETGADGLPLYTLQARQVQQEPDSNVVNLTTVHMSFRDPSGGQWQARSDRAVAQQDSAQIELSGAVNVTGTFAGDERPAHMLSDTLHVDTRTDIIRTRSPVTLKWAGAVVVGKGLVVDIKEHTVKLESEVHGHFAP